MVVLREFIPYAKGYESEFMIGGNRPISRVDFFFRIPFLGFLNFFWFISF